VKKTGPIAAITYGAYLSAKEMNKVFKEACRIGEFYFFIFFHPGKNLPLQIIDRGISF